MKKLFFFAIAALGMTVACQKEVKVENPDIDDNAPAEIVFGVNAPSITVTKTKAAVEDWTGTPDVYIFSGVVGEKGMDFTTPLIYNAKAQVSGGNTGATVKFAAADGSYTTPAVHYYEVDKTYNFYGYYKGDAVITGDEIKNESNVLTAEVTIDGDDDIMVATTDPAADLNKATYPVKLEKVYSAYAARRNVQPTLTFEHTLSRFKFETIQGHTDNQNTANVKITKLGLYGKNKGTLTIAPTQSFEATPDATEAYIYNDVNDTDKSIDPETGVKPCGSDLMVFPGDEEIMLEVTLTPDDQSLSSYAQTIEVTLVAEEITKGESDTFEAGKQYTVTITVYDLEQIAVTANLTEWGEGGEYTYDSDKEDGEDMPTYNTPTTEGVFFHFVETLAVGSRVYADKEMTTAMADGTYTDTVNAIVYVVESGVIKTIIPYFTTAAKTSSDEDITLYHTTKILAVNDAVYKTAAETASSSTFADGQYTTDACVYVVADHVVTNIYNNITVNTDVTLYYEGEAIAVGTTLYSEVTTPTVAVEGKYTTATEVYVVNASGAVEEIYHITAAKKGTDDVTLYHTAETLDLGVRVWKDVVTSVVTADAADYVVAGKTYTVNENGWIVAVK